MPKSTPDQELPMEDDAFGAAPHERPVPRISIHGILRISGYGRGPSARGQRPAAVEGPCLQCNWAACRRHSIIILGSRPPTF